MCNDIKSTIQLSPTHQKQGSADRIQPEHSINSAIHKAAGRWQERPQRPFPYSRLQGFSGIVPGKTGNGSAGGFVNSAVSHVTFCQILSNKCNKC